MAARRKPQPQRTGRKPASRQTSPRTSDTIGKRVTFDRETWQAIDLLARDSMKSFQELADEAFRDLLDKHGRPDTLRDALRASAAPRPRRRGR